MRLNRYLAAAGLGSRRSCEALITEGKVTLNGQPVLELATQVEPGDAVKVSGRLIHQQPLQYVLLNKPKGYVCSADDELGRQTIFDLLPDRWPQLHHVGRLDKESEGLILLTNDGDLSMRLTHPRFKMEKEYEVVLDHNFDFEKAAILRQGIYMEGGRARAESVERLSTRRLRIVLRQGMKRQIRQMFYSIGWEVEKLERIRIGPITGKGLPPGQWRYLSNEELAGLRQPTAAKPRPKPRRTHSAPAAKRATPADQRPRKRSPRRPADGRQ